MTKKAKKKDNGKPNISDIRKECLDTWSLVVRQRDGFTCQRCGSDKHPQAHHIFPKKYYPYIMLRPEVGITLCRGCHYYFAEGKDLERIRDFMISIIGEEMYQKLKKDAEFRYKDGSEYKWTIKLYRIELEKLKRMVDR